MASQVAPDKISEIAPLTAQARRALLIGSSYGNLLGTENDVNIIERLLRSYEFDDIKKLCGEDATRQKILDEWESLTARSSPGDAVVIYYSGHGSLSDSKNAEGEQEQRWRIQFIIPIDFDPTLTSWQGISDGELSQLLLQTTNRTRNVTCILDCCHSSRAIRDLRAQTPSNVDARVKLLPLAQKDHNQIVNLLGTPGLAGVLDDNYIWTNPHAVRIAAAAVDEGAWECSDGTSVSGILTKTLAEVMDKAGKTTMSWWNIMLGVRELVGRKFVQHPRSEGPDFRVPFSVGNGNANALLAEIEESGSAIVRGGKVDGVRVGDVYNITQLGSQGGIATATVTKVYIFTAEATLTPEIPHNGHPLGLVFAVPHRRSRWPAEFPDLQGIQARLDESKYLERCESGARPLITLQWKHDNDNNESVVLRTDRGVQLWEGRADNGMISPQAIEKLFSVAEKFAQAQHILNLEPDSDESSLKAAMKVGLSRVEPTGENFLWQYDTTMEIETGPVAVTEGESICIRIQNNSDETVYVSVFIVSTNGDTYLLSKAWTMGVVLKPGGSERLAKRQQPLRGISMAWLESVSRLQPIEENLVLVITSEEVDLRAFHNVSPEYDVTQQARGPADPAVRGSRAAYDVVRLRYSLIPRSGIVEQRG